MQQLDPHCVVGVMRKFVSSKVSTSAASGLLFSVPTNIVDQLRA